MNDFENPYVQGKPFHWIRQRVRGGPESLFLPPMEMTSGEALLRGRVRDKMNRVITIGRALHDVFLFLKPMNRRGC